MNNDGMMMSLCTQDRVVGELYQRECNYKFYYALYRVEKAGRIAKKPYQIV
jgi:hypothetical protein